MAAKKRKHQWSGPEFTNRLRRLMAEQDVSQAQLGRGSNISKSSACRYYHGDRQPSMPVIVSMAKFLGVSVAFLAGEAEPVRDVVDQDIIERLEQNWHQFSFEDKTLVRVMVQVLSNKAQGQ